ncbi:16S rRNA (guanine(966)-N(2))-methyltransferase RsmD [Pelagibacteraceae bacterium]|jgi:16S rRNA (guanine966-N2)-methyltransferase|nr:16S rRNA (guanine(966)-N(2))-methyltransferase RsmD [Pelagibacteraceae bacterium]
MRIISGSLKGKSINFLKNSTTRPLKDAVRENIFNILKHSNLINGMIDNANILDLYSGTGSFGLECISRGAKKVTFVEHDKDAANILNKNLIKLNVINKASIINNKVDKIFKKKTEKFDIFFFDPPFADKEFKRALNLIKTVKIYNIKHVVIIHREKKAQDNLDAFVDIIISKQYGRSKIIFGVFN